MGLYIYHAICDIEEKKKYLQVEGNLFNLFCKNQIASFIAKI